MKKKLILFDFDGTIADNSEGILNCIDYALKKLGKDLLPKETAKKFIGPSLFDSYRLYVENNEEEANKFVSYYREHYAPVGSTQVKIYDGITNLLDKLKEQGYITAICSSKPLNFVIKISKEQKIDMLFDKFFCPDFASHTSGKTDLILNAVNTYNVSKEEAILIGDTIFDIKSAKQAGINSIAVLYGFGEKNELQKEGADYIAENVEEIYSLVKMSEQIH